MLVNEFGEIGIDGALLDADGVAVEEVAGGCLCCVAAPAFTVGLNRLIRQYRPERILIEPSGLGHPAQILKTLRSPPYDTVLTVDATVCVMDARHLSSTRHREHPTFQDQIHLADILIANKADLYSEADESAFHDFAAALVPPKSRLGMVANGRMSPEWLLLSPAGSRKAAFPEAHAFLVDQQMGDIDDSPVCSDWQMIEGADDEYYRAGWLIDHSYRFDVQEMKKVLDGLPFDRIKAAIAVNDAHVWLYNRAGQETDTDIIDSNNSQSRIQIIHSSEIDARDVDRQLRNLAAENTRSD